MKKRMSGVQGKAAARQKKHVRTKALLPLLLFETAAIGAGGPYGYGYGYGYPYGYGAYPGYGAYGAYPGYAPYF